MYIESLELRGYNRFLLLPNGNLNVEFTSPVILIEGTNGAGKSSLFNELTPLPADKEDFDTDGYKKIVITKGGHRFVLVCDFSIRSPFSFVMDDEELNTAGIISAQRALVYQYFGITENIRDILIGLENFTTSSIGGRKKLFSTLTKLNIDHVLKNYAKLNDEYNLQKLKLRTETNQLKTEESRLVSDDTLNKVKKELKETNELIDDLLTVRQELSQWFTQGTHDGSYEDLSVVLQEQQKVIDNNYVNLTNFQKRELPTTRDEYIRQLTEIDTLLDETYNRLAALDEEKRGAEVSVGDSSTLQIRHEELTKQIESQSERVSSFRFVPETFHAIERAFSDIYTDVREVIVNMTPNPTNDEGEYLYTQVKLDRAREQQNTSIQTLGLLDATEDTLRANVSILENMEHDIECPCCGEKISLKEVMKNDTTRTEKIKHIHEQKINHSKSLKESEDYIKDCVKYFEAYSSIMRVARVTREAIPRFWENINDRKLLTTNPQGISNLIIALTAEVELCRDLMLVHEESVRVKKDLDLSMSIDRVRAEQAISEFKALELRATKLQQDRSIVLTLLQNTDRAINAHKELELSCRKVDFTKGVVREHNLSTLVSQLQNMLTNEIRDLRLIASELDQVVINHGMVEHTLESYKRNIADTESEMKVLEAFLKELSPKDGIIALTISSFLNTIINNINKTIESIWSYPMKLSTLDVGNESLNYRFKLEAGIGRKPVKDIARASAGQQEIINLSFKLVIYKLLGFEQYSLFLDEVSKSMDETHTESMNRLVHSFIHESDFSQVFIISHKESMEFLRNCQVINLGWGA